MATVLRPLIVDLQKADRCGDFDKALKIADKIIRNHPKENFAYKCKLVALIQLGKLEDAAKLIEDTPVAKMGNIAFENAYILYRKNQNEKALNMLEKADQSEEAVIELKSQLLYRLEKYEEAQILVTKLLKTSTDEDDSLRQANLIAIESQLETTGKNCEPQKNLDGFEQMYNSACHWIEKQNYEYALKLLDKAIVTCKEVLNEDGLPEEDIDEELAIILVQKGYVLQKIGKNDEASKIYSLVYEKSPTDVNAKAALYNNLPTTRSDIPVNDARKKIKVASQIDKIKLSRRQQRVLLYNQALINLLSNQREPCRKILLELQQNFGQLNEAILLETALFIRQKEIQKALETLSKANDTIEAKLLKSQILINSGRVDDGIQELCKLPNEIKFSPAILSLIINVYEAKNDESKGIKIINEALTYWKTAQNEEKKDLIIKKISSFYSAHGNHQKAIELLEERLKNNPDDPALICRLIKEYGIVCNPKAEELMEKLQPTGSGTGYNVDELEENDWIIYGQKYKKKEAKVEEIVQKSNKRKRKRKIILPKHYDPNVPADPERWLPKAERSGYKKKNKKHKDDDVGRGTQGAANDAMAEKMDYSRDNAGHQNIQKSPVYASPSSKAEGPRQKGPPGKRRK